MLLLFVSLLFTLEICLFVVVVVVLVVCEVASTLLTPCFVSVPVLTSSLLWVPAGEDGVTREGCGTPALALSSRS